MRFWLLALDSSGGDTGSMKSGEPSAASVCGMGCSLRWDRAPARALVEYHKKGDV